MAKHAYLTGFQRSLPVSSTGSKALCQRLARLFIDECHLRGLVVRDVEAALRASGKLNVYKNKVSDMACGRMRPFQYVYFFEVLFEAIGIDVNEVVTVHPPGASPVIASSGDPQ